MRKKQSASQLNPPPEPRPPIFTKTRIALYLVLLALLALFIVLNILKMQQSISEPTAAIASEIFEAQVDGQDEVITVEAIPPEDFVPNQLLVKIKQNRRNTVRSGKPTDTGLASLNSLNKEFGVTKLERLAKPGKNSDTGAEIFGWYLINFTPKGPQKAISVIGEYNPARDELQKVIAKFKTDPNIEAAEPNHIVHTTLTPNDPYFNSTGSLSMSYPDLWGMKKINAEAAWDQSTGSASIIVADIDTGVDRNHPDLVGNMWVNTEEIPNNGVDDDNNGYIDDYYGWDYANDDNDPMDDHGHGTHTVGTIAAVGNNALGVVGVNWNAKIMALKFLSAGGSGDLAAGIRALQYAADMGARISSNSWGCDCANSAMDDAVKYEHDRGMVTVVAAGNDNADAIDFSPADSDYSVTVAASDPTDLKASFSNWGEKIDVAAPGVYILSTRASVNGMCDASRTIGSIYCVVSGTSMATPHVAGLAALLLSKNPSLSNEEVRQIIRGSTDDLGASGKDRDYGYGRINANNALLLSNTHPLTPVITSPSSRTQMSEIFQITGSVPGPNFKNYKLELGIGRQPTSWILIVNSTTQVINGVLGTFNPNQVPDGHNILRLTATDTNNKDYQFQVHDLDVDNVDAVISSPNRLITVGNIKILGTALSKNGVAFSKYNLDWGFGTSPTSWSTSGITLNNGGLQPVSDNQLGTWDTTTLTPNQIYSLRLTVNSVLSNETTFTTVTLDTDVLDGWPKIIDQDPVGGGDFSKSLPAIADLDGDGTKEIIVGVKNKVYVFRKDGTNFPGFPALTLSEFLYAGAINVEDLDGDGKKEIVAQYFNTNLSLDGESNAYINVYRFDGTMMPGWPKKGRFVWYFNSPTIADLNGDGKKEIVALEDWMMGSPTIGYLYILHAYGPTGIEIPPFPKLVNFSKSNTFPTFTSFSIADMDKDGKPEMAMGFDNRIYLLDNIGNITPGWPYTTADQATTIGPLPVKVSNNLAFGDINGDGNLELLAFGEAQAQCPTCPARWFAFNKNGNLLPGFPKKVSKDNGTRDDYIWYLTQPFRSPLLADLNGDGKDEIIAGFNKLFTYDYSTDSFKVINTITIIASTVLSDVDGDNKLEYVLAKSESNSLESVNSFNDDGTRYWTKNGVPQFLRPLLVSDLDNDGNMELLGYNIRPSDVVEPGLLVLWSIPSSGSPAKYEWPMMGHDPARTGRLIVGNNSFGDTSPPTVLISYPVNSSVVQNIVSIDALASDNVGVSSVEFYIDDALVFTDTSSPYSYSWDTLIESNGLHEIVAVANDAAGNAAISPSVLVSVNNGDSTPPSAPSNLQVVDLASSYVTLAWSASVDNIGVQEYWIIRNGVTIGSSTSTLFTDYSVSPSTAYSYQVVAVDTSGNPSAGSNVAFVNTPAAPDTQPPSAPSNLRLSSVSSTQVNILWNPSSDNVGVVGYKVFRGGVLIATVGSTSYGDGTVSPDSSYQYQVSSYDGAGLESPRSNTLSVTTPPVTPVLLPGTVAGKVSASITGAGISGAKITIKNPSLTGKKSVVATASANSQGDYAVVLPPGAYTIESSASGYVAKSGQITIQSNVVLIQNFLLDPQVRGKPR
ncbi:MAG: S8 family serine peptidase [Nanoarchaeota archaeon]